MQTNQPTEEKKLFHRLYDNIITIIKAILYVFRLCFSASNAALILSTTTKTRKIEGGMFCAMLFRAPPLTSIYFAVKQHVTASFCWKFEWIIKETESFRPSDVLFHTKIEF